MSHNSKREFLRPHSIGRRPFTLPKIGNVQRRWVVLMLLAAFIGSLTLEVAAQEVPPGETDPIVPTARRTLFADQHALIAMPQNPNTEQDPITYTDWARSSDLESLEFQEAFVPDLQGIQEARAASGRILNQKTEQVAVGWYSGTDFLDNTIQVDILSPTGQIEADAVSSFPAISTSAFFESIPQPNWFAIAAGNLNILLDEQGNDHDEVLVCYLGLEGNNVEGKIRVLDYTTVQDNGVVVQSTSNAPGISGLSDGYGLYGADTAIGCAKGDINGDGVDEIIWAAVSEPGPKDPSDFSATVQVFQYTNDGENPQLEARGDSIRLPLVQNPRLGWDPPNSHELWVSIDVVTGDFNADGRMEIAVSTVQARRGTIRFRTYPAISILESDTNLNLTVKSNFANFQSGVTTREDFDNQQGSYACLSGDSNQACEWVRATVVAGLFKFDPSSGFPFDRRQLAVVYNLPFLNGGGLRAQTLEISDDLETITPLGDPVELPQQACGENVNLCPSGQRFSVSAGGYIGAGDTDNPQSSLVVTNWESTGVGDAILESTGQFHGFWIQPTPMDADNTPGSLDLIWDQVLLNGQDINGLTSSRLPAVAWDREGASVYLGTPVRMTVYDLVRADYIIGEPPKHMFWWPPSAMTLEEGQVRNVSRDEDFFVQLTDSEEIDYSITTTDATDWTIGGSLSASSKGSVEIGANVGIVKTSATGSIEVSGKIGYDYNENKSSYEMDYRSETREFEGVTERGDLIRAQLQTFDIWRYPVSGVPLEDGLNAFWEISFPGGIKNADGGGLTFDWYTPSYENGNILSYPIFQNNTYTPPDCCAEFIFLENGQEVTRSMPFFDNQRLAFDETAITLNLEFSESSGSGEEKTYGNKLSESAEIQVGFKTETKIFGGKAKTETKASANLNNSNSWSSVTSSDSTTNTSTGFTLSKPAGDPSEAYFFLPIFYLAQDGTVKVKHAVDILGARRPFWAEIYGKLPDGALKLPRRFSAVLDTTESATWVPNESDDRKEIRGFFTRFEEPNQAGTFPLTPGSVVEGTRVRLEVEVHNYSLAKNLTGLPIVFEAAPYDSPSNTEGPRVPLVCEAGSILLLSLDPLEKKLARCVWDTTGFGPGIPKATQEYRLYVTLDPDNQIEELYEGTEGPGQNNQGWALFEVDDPRETFSVPTPTAEVPNGADVHLDRVAIALEVEGKLETSFARVTSGQRTPLRVCVETDQTQTGYHHVLIYDGNPEREGTLIEDALLPGIERGGPTCTWITDFRFEKPGRHTLYAQVLETRIDGKVGNAVDTLRVRVARRPTVRPIVDQGAATGLISDDGQGHFHLSGTFQYTGNLDLNNSTLIVGEVLDENRGTGELIPEVNQLTGQPLVLFAKEQQRFLSPSQTVVFETLEGQEPQVHVEVSRQGNVLRVDMMVEKADILQPSQCGPLRSTKLTTSLLLTDDEDPPVEIEFRKGRWSCQINAEGEVTTLELPRG